MAWKEVDVEHQRKLFIEKYLLNEHSITELCRQFDISRPIGYKWIHRYMESGFDGLCSLSCAPKKQAFETPEDIVFQIIALRSKYSRWGPKKLLAVLKREYPEIEWPSTTTIGKILLRNGLVTPRKIRRRFASKTSPLSDSLQSNDVWCTDFKGWHLTRDSHKCEPFTLTDNFSRYLFACVKLEKNNTDHVWGILERCFYDFGLPRILRSDNGSPFATSSPGRLSSLSIKLIKAGVMPEWIEPGNPQQNGRHERMHLTLKQEGIFPELNLHKQELKLEEFIYYYNYIRPHEAIDQKTPSDVYKPSNRSWNGRLISPEYPSEYRIGKVKSCGKMSLKGGEVYIGRVFEGEPIGLRENTEGGFTAYYGPILLGNIQNNHLDVIRRKNRKR